MIGRRPPSSISTSPGYTSSNYEDDDLEVLKDATLEEYDQLLERELQPTLEYFEQMDEELIEKVPLGEEEEPNFRLPGGLRLEGG